MANLDQLNEHRVEIALVKLAETDILEAELNASHQELNERLKAVKSALYLEAEGTDGVRKAMAESSEQYRIAVAEWAEVWKQWKILSNQRQHEMRIIDLWRSLEASRRRV